VSVQPVSLPFTPVLLANTIPICFGDSIRLSTDTYNGQNVNYQWYTGPQSSSTLLGSTKDPGFIIKQPAVGIYQYFVIIGANGCTSVQSQPITVNVYARPVAVISSPPLAVNTYCEGQPITFSTSSQGTPQAPYSYQWTGPSSFNYTVQNPQLIPKAGLGNAGMYTLVVTQNGCVSDPAKVTVNVTPKPPVPMITADSLVCEGATVQLNCTPANAANYIWQYSGNPAINTTVPKLILPGVSVASTGDWKVQIIQNNCTSDASPTFHIDVQAYPDVSATAKITLCDYDTLKLNATANKPLPTWVWTGPSGFTTTYSQNTKSFPPHSGLYKVVGTTKNGCADSATVNVLAVTHPFVTATNDAPICSDGVSAARLQPVVVSMNGPFIFTWTGPGGWGGSSDSIPTIPSVSSANNGPYTVVVKDKYGCKSDPATTTINTQQLLKAPAILITPSSGIVCQGDTVTLKIDLANTSYPSTAKFIWHTPAAPNGLPPSAQSSMIIYGAQLADAGMYRVQVITDTCSSNISGPTTLVVHPNPAKPIPYYVTPLCEGGTLVLGIQNPVSGGTYTWSSTTPIPFAWTGQTATIPNVSQGNAGKYSVIVKLNGCVSTRGDTVVNIASAPKRPMIQPPNPSRFCREQAAQLKLLLKPDIVLPQTKFIWVLQQNNDTLSISSSTSFITNDLSHLHPGANTIRVKAYLNPCDSEWSDSVTVYLDTIPTGAQAYAGADRVLCISNGLKLDAAPVAGAAGIWTQTTGPTVIFNNTDPKTSVSGPGLAAGNIYRFAWTLSNGGCKNFSSDTVKIKTVAPEKAMAMDDTLRICSDTLVEIHAKQGVLSHGKWIQPGNQQDPLGVVIHQPDSTTTLITHLYASNLYVFYWTLADIGCGVSRDSVIVIDYSPKPDAGPDQPFCSPNPTYNLNASGIYPNIGETGLWTSKDTSLKFTNPTNNITTVRNLKYGLNEIYWTIDGGYCGLNSRDTVIINYQRQPTAVEDTIYVGYGKTIDFDVLTNDVFLPSYTFTTKTQPDHGTLTGNGTYTYQPDAGFSGQDQFIYQICNQLCKDSTLGCSATFVRINVASIGDCVIPTIITPNNDRVNDAFVIPASCLNGDGGGQIELTVFNQWGDLVYHSKPYNNDWEGTYNGQPLPVGTYFFELILNEQEKPKTGFLIIQQ
jgi:gliding motility-associated-like protein